MDESSSSSTPIIGQRREMLRLAARNRQQLARGTLLTNRRISSETLPAPQNGQTEIHEALSRMNQQRPPIQENEGNLTTTETIETNSVSNRMSMGQPTRNLLNVRRQARAQTPNEVFMLHPNISKNVQIHNGDNAPMNQTRANLRSIRHQARHITLIEGDAPVLQPRVSLVVQPNRRQNIENSPQIRNNNSRRVHNSARNYSPNQNIQRFVLPEPKICHFCGAKIFLHETLENCCKQGKVANYPRPAPPPELVDLCLNQNEESIHFRQNFRSYNHVFSFTTMGVNLDQNLASGRNGVFSYRAQGTIYHRIGSLLPTEGTRPRFLQLYIYDTDHEIENRHAENPNVRPALLNKLKQILDTYNPFVNIFRHLGQHEDIPNCRLMIKELMVDRRVHALPTTSQVAAIIVGADGSESINGRDIIVQTQTGQLRNIPDTAGYYDPLQYPLLLPLGQYGWDLRIHSNGGSTPISCRCYYSYLLQIRPREVSLFLHAGRLLQQYVVDMFVKIETMRMRFYRDHQRDFRAELYHGLQDAVNNGETQAANVGRRTILPPSHMGSPRDMHRRYQDAMALVRRYGKPDLFITVTCNPLWPEITRELFPGQQSQDRSELTTRIFRARLEELKNDMFQKGVLGKVVAHLHVIEFQKRGLPHAHILLIFDTNDRVTSPDEYDQLVRAEIPCPETEPDLYNVVTKHMIHHPCGDFNRNVVCMKNGSCKKGYPKAFAPVTLQGNDSYPIYRRRENGRLIRVGRHYLDNRWVVPYNPFLLLKYNCHINVEICSSIQSVKYLYKYVYKGPDRVSLGVSTTPQGDDEISQFVNARWVCAPEALWRIFKFPISAIIPSVLGLQLHLPNRQQVTFYATEHLADVLDYENRSKTMLTEFFQQNLIDVRARQYLYTEFLEKYWWKNNTKQWLPRSRNRKAIGRMYTTTPTDGERYYLRLLLNHVRGPLSFDDLLTVNGIQYSTFKETAYHRGLLENDNSIKECLRDAANTHMPYALRRLFVTILVYCEPNGVRELWDEFYPYMIEDYPSTSNAPTNNSYFIDLCLRDLNNLLLQYNKTISDFDIPKITMNFIHNSNISNLILEQLSIETPVEDLESINQLNFEQKDAFDMIIHSLLHNTYSVFFIDGPGGTGKTYLYRAILAYLRSQNIIVLATATSGIASLALPGGRTAHSRFKIPIKLEETSTCRISKQSDLAQLIRQAKLIIWDEATMANRFAIEALDRTLRDITDSDVLFGGKLLILGGDFRQVLPVVPHGTRGETVDACLVKSSFWSHVKIIHLKQNMRAINDPFYAEFLLRLGNGDEHYVHEDFIKLPDDIIIPWHGENSIHSLIDFVFPALGERSSYDLQYVMDRAIITPKNETVDQINDKIINDFTGNEVIYYSFDKVEDDTLGLYQQEFLNSPIPGGLAPHKLSLKVGTPIMLLRNIDTKIGLCNGTRLICRNFHSNLIDAEIAVGSFRGTRVFIPRIPLKPTDNINMPFNLIRKQFPIKLAFALTINKSQGQTIPNVGIYLPEHVFSHGQLYVALSRGVSRDNTKILVRNGKIPRKVGTHTRNVVYRDVLLTCNENMS